jgi:hypothetical protein
MASPARTGARPPEIVRRPLIRPLSRANGATPTDAAIELAELRQQAEQGGHP